jgi:hypothetical protein
MADEATEQIMSRIRSRGYTVEAGTFGYQVRMAATDASSEPVFVDADNTYFAAVDLAAKLDIDIADIT